MLNPYLNRTAIKDDADFFGRSKELATIFSRIAAPQPQSVCVVGERRMGKSSLLRAVLRRRAQLLKRPDEFIFVFLDVQEQVNGDVSRFFRSLLEEIGLAKQDRALAEMEPTYENIRKLVASFARNNLRLVILLDEFETVTQNSNFSLEFFSFLRSLPNNYPVSFVLTSSRELKDLCHSEEIAGSPFFNIFHKANLYCFSADEARELVEVPSSSAGHSLAPYFTTVTRLAGYFPFYLQLACCAFFDHLHSHPDNREPDVTAVWQAFYEEVQPHYESAWKRMVEAERTVCLKIANKNSITPADRRFVDQLARRGYVRHDETGTHLFSDVFDAFVQTQCQPVVASTPKTNASAGPKTARPYRAATAGNKDVAGVSRPIPKSLNQISVDELLGQQRRIDELLKNKFLRHLAVAYIDLVGSTQFSERRGPFAAFNLVKRLESRIKPIVRLHRGEMIKLVGDAVIARFDSPDDAVGAAVTIQRELAVDNARASEHDHIRVKIAVNFGEAVAIEGDVYGDAMNVVERVLRETTADQIMVSEFAWTKLNSTLAVSFVEHGVFSLKGKEQPVRLYRYRTE